MPHRRPLSYASLLFLFCTHCSDGPSPADPSPPSGPSDAGSADAGPSRDAAPSEGPDASPLSADALLLTDDPSFQFDPVSGSPQSPAQTFKFTNRGASPSATLAVDIHGNDEAHFHVTKEDCAGKSLAPAASCHVAVTLGSTTAGTFEATLRVHADPGGVARVDLSGIVTDAALAFEPSTLDLGTVTQGATSTPSSLTLTNTGGATSGPITVGSPLSSGFAITKDGCTGTTLLAGGACPIEVAVTLDATATGTVTSPLAATSQPGGSASATLSATAHTQATIGVSNVTFGHVGWLFGGSPPARTMIATNEGQDPGTVSAVYLTGASYEYVVDSTMCVGVTLPPGGTCPITVALPTERDSGDQTMQVEVYVDQGHSGTGTADVYFDVDGSELGIALDPSMGTLTATGGKACTLASCTFKYDFTTPTVTLTAVPASGYVFTEWDGYPYYGPCAYSSATTCTVSFSGQPIASVHPMFRVGP